MIVGNQFPIPKQSFHVVSNRINENCFTREGRRVAKGEECGESNFEEKLPVFLRVAVSAFLA